MIKVRFHGRGGQGMKTSSRILGNAAFYSGFYVQDFPIYGAERRGAPVVAFTIISESPILERGYIVNPDIVLVSDDTLISDMQLNPLEDMKEESIAFINTTKKEISFKKHKGKILCGDLTGIALNIIGKPILSTIVAGVSAKLVGIEQKYLEEATKEELEKMKLEKETIEKNVKLAIEGYNIVNERVKTKIAETKEQKLRILEVNYEDPRIATPIISFVANSYLKRTGNWRVLRPVIDYNRCRSCRLCYIYCPEGAIAWKDNFPYIDYENCKGCLICVNECPVKAINEIREGEQNEKTYDRE